MTLKNKQLFSIIFFAILLIIIIIFFGCKYTCSKTDTSWVVEKSCMEVKSQIYSDYGEVPSVSGHILYQKDHDYIVIVSYKLKKFDWEGKVACYIHGYEESNYFVGGITEEVHKNYKFNTEKLKSLWGIE